MQKKAWFSPNQWAPAIGAALSERSSPSANLNKIEAAGARYRSDIDGLRAVAVFLVVFYHFGIAPFGGGFVGVDVFFVISGFLITALVEAEIADGRFSLLSFYERRIRRIFPALFAVLGLSAAAALILLFPRDLRNFGESVETTIVFGSNFLFSNTGGYFDVAADRKPLLHTWSLAVEEQFYLVYPLLLLLLNRFALRIKRLSVLAVFGISLALSIWGVRYVPSAAFYLLPFRAWELMIGGCLAILPIAAPASRHVGELLSACGALLIVLSAVCYSPDTPFPGEAALMPCVGTGLILYGGRKANFVNGLLSMPWLVRLGLASYSIYLWHWPLLVFVHYAVFRDLSMAEKIILIALSVALGFFSLYAIEQPFRGRPPRISRRVVFGLAALSGVVLFSAGAIATLHRGLPQRFPAEVRALLDAPSAERPPAADGCLATLPHGEDDLTCRFGDPGAKVPTLVLWGDSHAAALMPAIAEAAIARHRMGLFVGYHTCPPLLGVESSRSKGCRQFNDRGLRLALAPAITDVVLHGRWAQSETGLPYSHEDAGHVVLTDNQNMIGSPAGNHDVFARGLERLIRALTGAGKRVTIVASVPEVGWSVPETLARLRLLHSNRDIAPTVADYLKRQQDVLALFDLMKKRYGVQVLYPHLILCANIRCAVAERGRPIYVDAQHLDYAGVKLLEGELKLAL